MKRATRLCDLEISEISIVDKAACAPARIVILKRADHEPVPLAVTKGAFDFEENIMGNFHSQGGSITRSACLQAYGAAPR